MIELAIAIHLEVKYQEYWRFQSALSTVRVVGRGTASRLSRRDHMTRREFWQLDDEMRHRVKNRRWLAKIRGHLNG